MICGYGRYLFTIQTTKVTSTWNSEAVEEPIGGLSSSQGYVNPHSVRPLRYHYVLLIFTHRRNRALGNFHPKQLQYSRTEKSSLLEFLTSKTQNYKKGNVDGQAKNFCQSSLKAFNVVQRVSCTNKSSRILFKHSYTKLFMTFQPLLLLTCGFVYYTLQKRTLTLKIYS